MLSEGCREHVWMISGLARGLLTIGLCIGLSPVAGAGGSGLDEAEVQQMIHQGLRRRTSVFG